MILPLPASSESSQEQPHGRDSAQEVAKKDANNKTSSSPTLDWANKACNTKLCELKDKILTRKHIPRQQFPLEINHFIAYPSLSTRNNSQVPNFEGQFLLKLFI